MDGNDEAVTLAEKARVGMDRNKKEGHTLHH